MSLAVVYEKPEAKKSYLYSLKQAAGWLNLTPGGVLRLLRVFSLRMDTEGLPFLEAWTQTQTSPMNGRQLIKATYACKQSGIALRAGSLAPVRMPVMAPVLAPVFTPEALHLLVLLSKAMQMGCTLNMLRARLAQQPLLNPFNAPEALCANRTIEAFRQMLSENPFQLTPRKLSRQGQAPMARKSVSGPAYAPRAIDDADLDFMDCLNRQEHDWLFLGTKNASNVALKSQAQALEIGLPDQPVPQETYQSLYEKRFAWDTQASSNGYQASQPLTEAAAEPVAEIDALSYRSARTAPARATQKRVLDFDIIRPEYSQDSFIETHHVDETATMFNWLLKKFKPQQAEAQALGAEVHTAKARMIDTPDAVPNVGLFGQPSQWQAQGQAQDAGAIAGGMLAQRQPTPEEAFLTQARKVRQQFVNANYR
ncbi:MAG: hypothetical protein VKJ06_00925 [Vampirovibrionales bacterium]|nr:hypothetical protein [Vampirovibrionales bacterium]